MYDDTYVDEVARKAQPATEVPSASTSPSRSIWLRGIGEAHVESALWEAFESCGEIDGVNIYGAKHVAFVHFMSEDAGRSALEKAINDPICGTKLQVNSAKATAPPPRPMGRLGDGVNPSNILLIHDLPRSVNDTHVFAVLKHFHGLMKVSPLPETTTVSVHFRTVPDATVCRNTLHGRTVCGATVSVQYAKHSIPVVCDDTILGEPKEARDLSAVCCPNPAVLDNNYRIYDNHQQPTTHHTTHNTGPRAGEPHCLRRRAESPPRRLL